LSRNSEFEFRKCADELIRQLNPKWSLTLRLTDGTFTSAMRSGRARVGCLELLRSDSRLRGLSVLLVALLVAGSFSTVTGLNAIGGSTSTRVSLNVCDSPQTLNLVAMVVIARPDSGFSEPLMCSQGSMVERPDSRS